MIKINSDNQPYCVVRGIDSGVFAGFLIEETEKRVVLGDARWIWEWSGAFSIVEMSKGVDFCVGKCKFSITVEKIILKDIIQIIQCTEEGYQSFIRVPNYEY